jgi:diguanylate cyclase (GGDEF)-like protein/PAS domain S-box-containing protein
MPLADSLTVLAASTDSFELAAVFGWTLVVLAIFMSIGSLVATRRYRPTELKHNVAEILDTLSTGILILDHRGCIVTANLAVCRMFGTTRDRLKNRDASSLHWICTRTSSRQTDPWHRALHGLVSPDQQWMRYQTQEGSIRTFSVQASLLAAIEGREVSVVVNLQDVTEFERRTDDRDSMLAYLREDRSVMIRRNEQLQVLASTDSLTGCLNRRSFFSYLEEHWNNGRLTKQPHSVLMIDIDHFKRLNDTHGHDFGDQVLLQISSTLRAAFEAPAQVCRYGGEEFCVSLPGHGIEAAYKIAHAVRGVVENIRFAEDPHLVVTISVGVSDTDCLAKTPVELIGQADRSLYNAKAQGRNRVCTFVDMARYP